MFRYSHFDKFWTTSLVSQLFFKLKLLGKICTVLYFVNAAYFCISMNSIYLLHVTVHQKSLGLNCVFINVF